MKKFRTALNLIGCLIFRIPTKLKKMFLYGTRHYCPVCQSRLRVFLPAGAVTRMNARCPICGALERHRLEWIFLQTQTDLFDGSSKRMLHVAPEPAFEFKLKAISGLEYITADLNDPHVMVKMDLTDIKYPENHFDIIYCCHVLEHIPDDRKAMRELFRILKQGGWAMLLVPMKTQPTLECLPGTSREEREKLFDGADHVRAYGPDYVNRLKEAGFDVQLFSATEVLDLNAQHRNGVDHNQKVVFCTKHYTQSRS